MLFKSFMFNFGSPTKQQYLNNFTPLVTHTFITHFTLWALFYFVHGLCSWRSHFNLLLLYKYKVILNIWRDNCFNTNYLAYYNFPFTNKNVHWLKHLIIEPLLWWVKAMEWKVIINWLCKRLCTKSSIVNGRNPSQNWQLHF